MPPRSFFDNPPVRDATLGRRTKWQIPPGGFRNGYFQHIVWLGVNGYAVVNHFAPRRILLVDPWPSYRRTDVARNDPSPKARLLLLVNWLRTLYGRGYRFAGILVTHQHFDHVADVPAIVELLRAPAGRKVRIANLNRRVRMTTPTVAPGDAPVVYADAAAAAALRRRDDADCLTIRPVVDAAGGEVHYVGDGPCPPCGTPLRPFDAGGFAVQPYVWDHMNLTDHDANVLGMPGNRQRLSAVAIRWGDAADAKTTFVVGSAGEMRAPFCTGPVVPFSPPLEVDALIASVTHPSAPHYDRQLSDTVAYQAANLRVRDYVVPSHWEDYFFGPPKPLRHSRGFFRNARRVDAYQAALERVAPDQAAKVVRLRRLGFEYTRVPDPTALSWRSGIGG